jgi:hypothetical protein
MVAERCVKLYDMNLLNTVAHNRSDQFYHYYIKKNLPIPPKEYIYDNLVFSEASSEDQKTTTADIMIDNQYSDRVGLHRISKEKTFLDNIENEKIDIIIMDDFLEVGAILSYPKLKKYEKSPLFLRKQDFDNFDDFFTFGEKIDLVQSVINMNKIMQYLKLKQPNAKIFFIHFPYNMYPSNSSRYQRSDNYHQLFKSTIATIIPPVYIKEEFQVPNDPSLFSNEIYLRYAAMIHKSLTTTVNVNDCINKDFSASDIDTLNYIEDLEGKKLYYRFTSAAIPHQSPILVILHGHGSPRASRFRDKNWNIVAPIDDYGVDSYGSWWLGENGDFFVKELLHQLVKKIQNDTLSTKGLYFWGSSMGGYGALLHGMLLNAKAVYANIPQVKLLDTTYSERGQKKYFEPIFLDSIPNKYNDITNFLDFNNPKSNPHFIIDQSKYDYKNYLEEHSLYFKQKCEQYNIPINLNILPVKGHKLLCSIPEAISKLETICDIFNSPNILNNPVNGLIFKDHCSYAKFSKIIFDENSKWKLYIELLEYENDTNINFFFGERGSHNHGFARVKDKIYYRLGNGSYIGGLPYEYGSFIRLTVTYDTGKWVFSDGKQNVTVQQESDVIFNAIGSGYNGKEYEGKTRISYVNIQEYSKNENTYKDVGVWKLDENRGCIAFDSSGNHHHAVLTNTLWQGVIGNEVNVDIYPLAQKDWQQYIYTKPNQKFSFFNEAYNKEKDLFLWISIEAGLNDKNWKKGEKLLENIYSFDRFEPVQLPTVLTWQENPLNNRSWQWQYHQIIFYIDLLAAHAETGEIKYLDRLVKILTSWYNCNYTEEHPSKLSWHDHTTALRLRSLIYIWEYLRNSEYLMTEDFINMFLNLIETHCNVLSAESFYFKYNNHGFDQSLFLYLASAVFPEFENAKQWHDIALDRVIDEIGVAFTSEGMHIENSPSYLVGMLQRVELVSKMIQHYELENSIELSDILNNALKALAYLVQPNGTLPMIGDTDKNTKVPALNHLKNNDNFKLFEYVHSRAKRGMVGMNHLDAVFEESGYAVFRDKWHTKDTYEDMIHFVFKCGFLSTFHRHDDDLNFVLYGLGEEWFVDGGIYKYDEEDPYRKYLRSVKAHNIPVIANVKVSRSISKDANKQSKITDYSLNEETSWLKAKSFMYADYCVTRKIEYIRPNRFIITDKVDADSEEIIPYELMFHIPMDKKIEIREDNSVNIISQNSHKLQMLFDGECEYSFELFSGDDDKEVIGWQSKVFGKIEAIQTLKCSVVPKHNRAYSIVEMTLRK